MAVKKEKTRSVTLDGGIQFKPVSKPKTKTSSKDSKQKRSK